MADHLAYRDRDYEFSVYITDADGVAIDVTGSTWTFTLRRNNVEDVLATATPSIGSASGGRIDIAILAATMSFDGGRLVAELVRTDTGADTYARWYVSFGNPGQVVGGSGDITVKPAADMVIRAVNAPAGPAGAGAGVMTDFTGTAWRVFYSNAAGDVTELALGADGTFLKSNGAAVAPSFATPAGSGDVAKVGTPVNNQIGVWTGDGTLEGTTGFTFDSLTGTLTIAASGNLAFGAVTILDDAAGTMTLQNIDALDATTEATIEAAIDTLANLASVNGFTFSVGGNATISGTHSGASSGTNTGDQSAAAILAALLTVDGAGSLLDADLLDGNSSAAFATASHAHAAIEITSGTLLHERGGLEADVSAYSGFVKITAGATSAVAVSANGESLITAANYAAMRTLLDLEAGTDFYSISAADTAFQPKDADLTAIAGLVSAADKGIMFTGAGTAAVFTLTAAGLALLDDASAAAQATTLGLGTGDSPQFTAVNVGHASDTTLTRVSAGVVAIEGNNIVTAAQLGLQSYWIPAMAMNPRSTSGCGTSTNDIGTNDNTFYSMDFDAAAQEYATFVLSMPKQWNEGTITFVPYWTNLAGLTTENVVFSLAGAAISNDDTIDAAPGTVQTSNDTWLAQKDLHIGPASSAITIAGTPAAEDLVVFEVSRVVASDNLTGDAKLIGVKIFLTVDAWNDA